MRTLLFARANGDGEIRTLDPLLARQVLSQLSYTPMFCNQLFSILITRLHAIMPSMIPMHVTPLKRCGSTLIKGNPIFISYYIEFSRLSCQYAVLVPRHYPLG